MRTPSPLRRLAAPLLVATVLSWGATACGHPRRPTVVAVPGSSVRGVAATVTHVVDGDTVDLAIAGGGAERARLLGIDTPETVKPNTPVQCFGPEASARTKELLPARTAVVVQRDREARDRYGRLLLYVWRRDDGLFVNAALVADGFARTLSIAPNRAHAADLAAAAADARRRRAGLWGSCAGDHADQAGPGG
ncbi:MAG: thermonuclease family protein [Acidimicrobiales bacterium]|nr:thermonuclease family protein [Actinomycetota bacterium]